MTRIGNVSSTNRVGFRSELDSHADTCVVGQETALLINDFERPVNVHGYNETIGAERCKTVSAVVAYDHPGTGDTYMLTIHQAILIPGLKTNLLSTMQMRDNDCSVNDEPKHMVPTPTNNHHAIVTPALEGKESLRIPLLLHGVTSYFPSRKPTRQEYETCESQFCIDLTGETNEGNQHTKRYK